MNALQWLQQNNPYYKDIAIDHAALQTLPEDAALPNSDCLQLKKLEKKKLMMKTQKADTLAIVIHPRVEPTKDSAICSTVNDIDPMDCPDLGRHRCFDYPRPLEQSSSLQFDKLPDGTVRVVLTMRRNDPRVNSHNQLMIQHWQANVDLQMIVDAEACARYGKACSKRRAKISTSIIHLQIFCRPPHR